MASCYIHMSCLRITLSVSMVVLMVPKKKRCYNKTSSYQQIHSGRFRQAAKQPSPVGAWVVSSRHQHQRCQKRFYGPWSFRHWSAVLQCLGGSGDYCWWFRNPAATVEVDTSSLSDYLQGYCQNPRWCRSFFHQEYVSFQKKPIVACLVLPMFSFGSW